jgi:fumarylacetoacetase
LAKKFCIINITLDCYYGCIGAFRVPSPKQDPSPLLFATKGKHSFDIHLEAAIQPENAEPTVISKSNFKYMYWTMNQQLTHHTSNGCRKLYDIRNDFRSYKRGSMLELTWGGKIHQAK